MPRPSGLPTYYGVRKGFAGFSGVVETWAECKKHISCKGVLYRKFTDKAEAQKFVDGVIGFEKRGYYAVRNGLDGFCGVLTSWAECEKHVRVKAVRYKKFVAQADAHRFAQGDNTRTQPQLQPQAQPQAQAPAPAQNSRAPAATPRYTRIRRSPGSIAKPTRARTGASGSAGASTVTAANNSVGTSAGATASVSANASVKKTPTILTRLLTKNKTVVQLETLN